MEDIKTLLEGQSVMVAGKEYAVDVVDYVTVDPTRLEYEFVVHSQRVAIVGFAYERALAHQQKLESNLGRMYALCDAQARNNLTFELGGKKPTEIMVEHAVKLTKEYQLLENELLEAKAQTGVLRALKDAISHRKDVLVGLAANYRAEVSAERTLVR